MTTGWHWCRAGRAKLGALLLTWVVGQLGACTQKGPARSGSNAPVVQRPEDQPRQGRSSLREDQPHAAKGPSQVKGSGISVEKQRFLTLEEEPLLAESMRGLKAVWVFWPGTGDDQFHHMQVQAFRQRLDRLLGSRGDLVVLEFHHHHLSAQTAPRRDRSRHEHLWDPQAIVAMRLEVPKLPAAVIVSPDLTVFSLVDAPAGSLSDFYLNIIQGLASLDATSRTARG